MTTDTKVSIAEFEQIFESVKNWGRWGPDDEIGTLNYITPEKVREAAALVRSGRRVSMAIPINKVAGPDNPQQAMHFVTQAHDVPVDESKVRFALDFLGMAAHGDCHTHVDALNHISYGGLTYNGRRAEEVVLSSGGRRPGHRRLQHRHRRAGRPARHRGLSQRQVARARRGRGARRARSMRPEHGRAAGGGRHPRAPPRPSPPAPRTRALGQRPRRRGQGRAARRHDPVDARAEDRRVPTGR